MPFLEHSVTIASVLTILAITVDRYNGICRPTSDNEWKRFKVWHILLVIWFVACASSLPMLFIVIHKDSKFRDGTPIKVCRTYINETWEIVYIVAVFCIYFVLILLVLAVLITKMTRSLLAQANLYEGTGQPQIPEGSQKSSKSCCNASVGSPVLLSLSPSSKSCRNMVHICGYRG